MHVPTTCPLGICWEHFVNMCLQHLECSWWIHFRHMAGSHFSCEQDVTSGHIWGTCSDYIPDVNRMFLLGKCWAKCLNACNVLSMLPLKSGYPRPRCEWSEYSSRKETYHETNSAVCAVEARKRGFRLRGAFACAAGRFLAPPFPGFAGVLSEVVALGVGDGGLEGGPTAIVGGLLLVDAPDSSLGES
jgi:hypothetical protein